MSKRMSEKLFPRKVLRYTALKLQIFCNMGINIIGMYDVQMPITEKRIAKAIETDTNLGEIKCINEVIIPERLQNNILRELYLGYFDVIKLKHSSEGICISGIPKIIVMDNGINFRSQGLLTFLKTNGITSKFTTQFNPATNEQMVRISIYASTNESTQIEPSRNPTRTAIVPQVLERYIQNQRPPQCYREFYEYLNIFIKARKCYIG
ncbi:hypothetical protein HZH66_000866 [Vespula vulgaris]|uniref:Integrase catalytic domain-containing protein n=1 Tax=Vespula vulgaris TaxID=7454 RepID=A0A834KT87_VESVU|nr:hypothetical protein HZH66_000866 [Vespula vulgaris]